MSSLVPVEVYGLQVPAGDVAIEADGGIDFPATFRITMAAIDPTAAFESDGPARSTLKLIKIRSPDLEDDDDEEDEDDYDEDDIRAIEARLGLTADDDEDDESSDEEVNGGPSDPAKSRKARAQALAKEILEGGDDSMDDADLPNGVNGKSAKGKAKALDDEEDEEDDDEDEEEDIQEFVLCTLDPEKNYQQPLDITLNNESELCYFKVTGSHAVYLTGNWVIPPNEEDEDEEDEDYSDEDDLEDMLLGDGLDEDVSDEDDELDTLEDPRITEVASDDEEAPKLIPVKKGKNKRKADDSDVDVSMESIAEKTKPEAATNGTAADDKLSKKQKKKLKNNAGDAVPAAAEAKVTPSKADKKEAAADTPSSNGKKVQFAKQLEQGPTGGGLGVKVVEGVTLDDKKLGSGPAVKNGNTVEIRYIGKLKDGKVFDSNKKGKPFSFKVGKGEVVKGMDVGLRGMTAGGERRITIPSKLGYGSKGAGRDIPPNSDLIFEVKLLTIK